jgi:hypothetical protein
VVRTDQDFVGIGNEAVAFEAALVRTELFYEFRINP